MFILVLQHWAAVSHLTFAISLLAWCDNRELTLCGVTCHHSFNVFALVDVEQKKMMALSIGGNQCHLSSEIEQQRWLGIGIQEPFVKG